MSEGKTKSPEKVFYETRAPSQDLRGFGCAAWVMLPIPKLSAFGSTVRTQGVLVGYHMLMVTMQYWVLIDGVVISLNDVQFHESQIVLVPFVAEYQLVPVPVPTHDLLFHGIYLKMMRT